MSFDSKRPAPLYRPPLRKRCPVCNEISYSAAGIHPQCAAHQADPNSGRKKPRIETVEKTKSRELERWQKRCPACNVAKHVRQKVCDCGHTFT